KIPRNPSSRSEYEFELTDTANSVIFRGSFEDPLIKRYEFEDPENAGKILTKTVELQSAELTIRIPITENSNLLNFYRKTTARGNNRPEKTLISSFRTSEIRNKSDK
ncbi:MAG: hypothetical protein ACREBV_09460, partial [Candidatus Zixiibacteriota bacterium]